MAEDAYKHLIETCGEDILEPEVTEPSTQVEPTVPEVVTEPT